MSTSKNRYFILILLPLILTGCLGTKHLKENQKHLFRQSISSPDKIDAESLRELYAQRTNRRFLGLPIYHLVAFYYFGEKRYNKEKFIRKKEKIEEKFDKKIAKAKSQERINNLQFRKQQQIDRQSSFIENGNIWMQWGEPIAVYDSTLVKLTMDRFSSYLFSQGYFKSRVSTKVTSIGKFVNVNYRIDEGPSYNIDTIIYNIPDERIKQLVLGDKRNSLIKVGDVYSEDKLSAERERIDLLLKDHGYYDFSRQYIEWNVDTVGSEGNMLGLMLLIHNPANRGYHKQFTIDSVNFITDAGVTNPGFKRTSRSYRDVTYSYYYDNYNLKILSQRLFLSPGTYYSRTKTFNSQRQLANLDAFKFVNINYDTSGGKFIANIFTSPLDRYEWSNEVGLNVVQRYPGPFYSINFKKRNIFKGLENFELNGRIGTEGVVFADDIYGSTEAGTNASLVFPQFIWPFRESTQLKLGKYNPKTRLTVGYTYSNRPQQYTRTSTNLSATYTWQNTVNTQYSLSLANISLINSPEDKQAPAFRELLDSLEREGNYNLARSFEPSLVSSIIFGVTWNRGYGTFDKNSTYVRAQIESGGTSLNFLDTSLITKQGLQYFKYLRLNVDFRKLKILSRSVSLAYRINSGVAYSYGLNKTLPYEKFFFVGGSNSVRAWRPRRLGLGSVPPIPSRDYDPVSDGKFDYQFEKPGEIMLEGSVELRSNLVGVVDGAVFIDAGNVWAFREAGTQTVGNSQFKLNSFYKEFGVGTGFGFRIDFTFLILRFDIGIKAYDPAREPGSRWVLDRARFFKPYATKVGEGEFVNFKEPVIYNFNIGFPF